MPPLEPLTAAASPHRRWNPLRGEWVLVSPQRTARPWQGQMEDAAPPAAPAYDPHCYLCPGNQRAGGQRTPAYKQTFVFTNDYPALLPDSPAGSVPASSGLLRAEAERGHCRVVCFDPRHDLTLATMPLASVRHVVDVWAAQEAELSATPNVGYVQIFENRGAMMGASNPHPHGQIWATEHLPNEPARELETQSAHFAEHHESLLLAYLREELANPVRVVAENATWVVLVPFWAVWPFETLVLPRDCVQTLAALTPPQRDGLAEILQTLTRAYNAVFATPFPYSMGFHPAPPGDSQIPAWQLHAHFYPPLLRSATIRKFMVGFELLGSPQRDITPESAAETLRAAFLQTSNPTTTLTP